MAGITAAQADISGNAYVDALGNSLVATSTPPLAPIITSFSPANAGPSRTTSSTITLFGDAVTPAAQIDAFGHAFVDSSGNSLLGTTFPWLGEAGATVTVFDAGGLQGTTIVNADGTWSFVAHNLVVGQHVFTATLTDVNGTSPLSFPFNLTVVAAPAPPVPPIVIPAFDTCGALLVNALTDAGIVGIDEQIEPAIFNRAFAQVNYLIAQWARKRWLVYRLQDYSVISTGAFNYSVGRGANIDINPRPDRIEYAFLRFLNSTPGNIPVDIPLEIIQSHEDYSRITVKTIGTIAWRIFYDPIWPVGLLLPWPVPQAGLYEIHVGFKVVLPRFQSIQQAINFPPEYEAALNWCLVRRLRAVYQLPPDPEVDELARDALNVMRLANAAVGTLTMPSGLQRRGRAYDYRGDTDSF